MAFIMRSFVCNKIAQAISGFPIGGQGIKPIEILPLLRLCPKSKNGFEYVLENKKEENENLHKTAFIKNSKTSFDSEFAEATDIIERFQVDDVVTGVYFSEERSPKVKLKVCRKRFIREVMKHIYRTPDAFWKSSSLLSLNPKQKIVVEFSSPNIAKPFHMGHLRSTIIGNFICNLLSSLGHHVTRINYLGDWGTQFGLLKYGYDKRSMTTEDLKENLIKMLYKLYVSVNQESEKCSKVHEDAKEIFNSMEKGSTEHLETWSIFRELSIENYKKTYARLGVYFDEFHGESMYNLDKCTNLVNLMKEIGILETSTDGRMIYKCKHDSRQANVTIVKSDGSTMYITRDISAAIDRFEKYKFDKMFYVVDNSQHSHFQSLKNILISLGKNFAGQIEHIKFGRVEGMSTRKGTAIFLEDVLNEAQELMIGKQNESKNTVFDDPSSYRGIADVVGASAIIVTDLKRKRTKNYSFSWQDALQNVGDTGVRLQYTHCRLERLKENCGVECVEQVDYDLLVEPQVDDLVRCIARFDEVLYDSASVLESWMLTAYLFELSTAINKALKVLPVKNSAKPIAEARLQLFEVAKITLAAGMKILGLQPLKQM